MTTFRYLKYITMLHQLNTFNAFFKLCSSLQVDSLTRIDQKGIKVQTKCWTLPLFFLLGEQLLLKFGGK